MVTLIGMGLSLIHISVLAASHEKAAAAVRQYMDAGQDVAMLNIGDVSIYATFGYLQEILQAGGCLLYTSYRVRMFSG